MFGSRTLMVASICATMTGLSIAQVCNQIELYSGLSTQTVAIANNTWPESPEIWTNWGVKDGMIPPYIRFSGQSNVNRDWKGTLRFAKNYAIGGGTLQIQAHSVVPVQLSLAIETDQGESSEKLFALAANQTSALQLNLTELGVHTGSNVLGVVVKLVNVPAWQYVTIFFDKISLSCAQEQTEDTPQEEAHPVVILAQRFVPSDTDPKQAQREHGPVDFKPDYATIIKDPQVMEQQKSQSQTQIVVDVKEQGQLVRLRTESPQTSNQSMMNWYNGLNILSRNRLADSVIANPASLFQLANKMAAYTDNRLIPLLIADVDYEALACQELRDSTGTQLPVVCEDNSLEMHRYSHVVWPVSYVKGTRIAIAYEPAFMVTNRSNPLPEIQIQVDHQWIQVPIKGDVVIDMPQVGLNTLRMRMTQGQYMIENLIAVEVK